MSDAPIERRKKSTLDRIRQAKVKKSKALPKKKLSTETLAKAVTNATAPKLLFSLDATASRQPSWEIAKEISVAMFDNIPKQLDVALAYHSGGRLKKLTSYTNNKERFRQDMIGVRCEAGMTAICSILESGLDAPRLKAIVYIGDCFEEHPELAKTLAKQLSLQGIRLFIFHDTQNNQNEYAQKIFTEIATITKGAILPFDLNSPDILKEILNAIAYYATQGFAAVRKLNTSGAKMLLAAVKEQ